MPPPPRVAGPEPSPRNSESGIEHLEYDFVSFLAVMQGLQVPFFDFEPDVSGGEGIGERIHVIHLESSKGIVFKSEPKLEEKKGNAILINEAFVLRHPVLSRHPNIHRLLGVVLQPRFHEAQFLKVCPHLVFEKSDHGSLWEFMIGNPLESRALSFMDRLRLCRDIGHGIAAMHSLSEPRTLFPNRRSTSERNTADLLANLASLIRYRARRY